MRQLVLRLFLGILMTTQMVGAVEMLLIGTDGTPLAGAHVTVVGQLGIWIADDTGAVVLDPTPALPFILVVARADGVALKPVSVLEIPEGGSFSVTVEAAGSTVTVVSNAVPDIELPPASAATVMGQRDIGESAPTSLVDALVSIPGAGQSGDGHSAVPSLRGLPKHRTLILLDEGRVATERRAGPSATFLDPDTLGEVEVIRGPGSVAYGSDAFGGIIRARSRMPQPLTEEVEVTYALQGAQGAPGWGAAADVVAPLGGGGLAIGAHVRDYSNYDSPDGEVYDTFWESWGARAAWQAAIGGGVLKTGVRFDRAIDVGKPNPESPTKRRVYPLEESDRFHLGFDKPLKGEWKRLSLNVAWDRYRLVLDKDSLDANHQETKRDQSDVAARDYSIRVESERALGTGRLVLGANLYGRYDLEAVNTGFEAVEDGGLEQTYSETAIESAHSEDFGLFAAYGVDVGVIRLSAGLRGDAAKSTNSGGYFGDQSVSDTAVSGYFGGGIALAEGLELTLQIARGFREPLLSDRYYRGETARGFITGNPDLKAESSLQVDSALRYRAAGWQLGAYAYVYRISDLIERYKDGGDYFFRNEDEAEIQGIEAEAAVSLWGDVSLQLGAWWLRGRSLSDDDPLDDVPAPGISVVLREHQPLGLSWMVRFEANAEDDRPGPSEIVVPSYTTLDLSAGWAFSEALQIQLLCRNVFDKLYLASADEDTVAAPGRTFLLSLRGVL